MGERLKRAPRLWRAVRPEVYLVARRERGAAPPALCEKAPLDVSRVGGETGIRARSSFPRICECREFVKKSGANDDSTFERVASNDFAQHTVRVRAAEFRASRRVRRLTDAIACPRRAVSP